MTFTLNLLPKMKIWLIGLVLMVLLSCKSDQQTTHQQAPSATEPSSPDQQGPIIDNWRLRRGEIKWSASKVGGIHHGTIQMKGGELMVHDGTLLSGRFEIDMTTLRNVDLQGEQKEKLEKHLRSADFFDIDNHPVATFQLTVVSPLPVVPNSTHQCIGDLTIKGLSYSVNVPATINITDALLTARTPSFQINRNAWNISYRSVLLGTLPDLIIDDEITLSLSFDASPDRSI